MFVEITIRKKYFHEPLKDMMKESHLNTVKDSSNSNKYNLYVHYMQYSMKNKESYCFQ